VPSPATGMRRGDAVHPDELGEGRQHQIWFREGARMLGPRKFVPKLVEVFTPVPWIQNKGRVRLVWTEGV
jgi:hypothetical protein